MAMHTDSFHQRRQTIGPRVPELEMFPTPQARAAAVRQLRRALDRKRPYHLWLAFALLPVLLFDVSERAVSSLAWFPAATNQGIALSLALAGYGAFVLWAYRYRTPQLLREALLESGVAVCIACGYDLRRLSARRCPECGRRFDRRVREILDADDVSRNLTPPAPASPTPRRTPPATW